jgi:dihydrodipicolinate synthase/N-acetylneuraminate lyase
MSVETTVALSRHSMIAGLKDATGDNGRVSPMRSIIGDDFRLYSGAHRGGTVHGAWCTAHGARRVVHGSMVHCACARRMVLCAWCTARALLRLPRC